MFLGASNEIMGFTIHNLSSVQQAAEKVITIHEITQSNTKPHEKGALFFVLFRVRSCHFVDRIILDRYPNFSAAC